MSVFPTDDMVGKTACANCAATALAVYLSGKRKAAAQLFLRHQRTASVAIRGPGPGPFAGPDVCGAPGDADDMSCPGSDRWCCRCWL